MPEIYDHAGNPVRHGRARVNGIRMHYVTAGQGEPLLLLHGTPKTHYYWYKLIPLLTEHFTVVAPDLRGFGDTDRPTPEEGYDSRTNADDMAELMTSLGHDQFHLHGEDRGAEFAYVLAATRPERVKTLCFAEMLLSGRGWRSGRSSLPRTWPPSSTSRACGSGTFPSSGSPICRRC
jgi:pimeloyl-ACP methyl ester carboxylesterase